MKFLTWFYILWTKSQSLPQNETSTQDFSTSNFILENQEIIWNELKMNSQHLENSVLESEQKVKEIIAKVLDQDQIE